VDKLIVSLKNLSLLPLKFLDLLVLSNEPRVHVLELFLLELNYLLNSLNLLILKLYLVFMRSICRRLALSELVRGF
jgi:hypothetical protein